MIRPIPTAYDGVQFRSRLEARYAMFFDSLKIGWAYEVEGIDIGNGQRYLPDFWLADSRVYFEVKGPLRNRVDLVDTAQRYVDQQSGGHLEIDYPLFVIGDERCQVRAGSGGDVQFWLCHDCRCWTPNCADFEWRCRACGGVSPTKWITRILLPQMPWKPSR